MSRKPHVDWVRGLAVLLMILWHVLDAWTGLDHRDTPAFLTITFLGGWAAPLFVFLAGVSVPLAGAARMSRGLSRHAAAWSIEKRGWEILLLAHVFRFQSFLFNPSAEWNSLLMPDILNVIGLAVVGTAFCWERATSPRREAAWLLIPVFVSVAVITPWAPAWTWPSFLTPRLEAYIRPVGSYGVFSLFPWAAYVFAGAYLGGLMLRHRDEGALYRTMAMAGGSAAIVGALGSYVPSPLSRNAWTGADLMFAFRTGAMAATLAATWAVMRWRVPARSNFMMVFGRRSLFVYWVHVELAYGVFSYPLHHAFTLAWAAVACAFFTWGMVGLAVLWERHSVGAPLIPPRIAIAWPN